MKSRPMLEPPAQNAPAIAHVLWRASGPGRAWQWREWARSIKRGDRNWKLARRVLDGMKQAQRCYKTGANDYATLLLEQTSAEARGVLGEQARIRREAAIHGAKGGRESAVDKKADAAIWHDKIRPGVERRISAGKNDSEIANWLARDTAIDPEDPKTALDPETVRKYVAIVRKEMAAMTEKSGA